MNNTAHPVDRWIPWGIVAFFVIFMLLLSSFAWIAFHTFPGETTGDAYKKGLAYNTSIARAETQQALGWKATLQAVPTGNALAITFTLHDASGHAIDDAKTTANLIRPTQAGHDVQLVLQPAGMGIYRGTANLEWQGVWDIRISATRGTDNFQQSKSIVMQ